MQLSDDHQTFSDESSTEEKINDEDHRKNYISGDYYVMLAGKCTVYKSLRNEESFS